MFKKYTDRQTENITRMYVRIRLLRMKSRILKVPSPISISVSVPVSVSGSVSVVLDIAPYNDQAYKSRTTSNYR